MKAINNLIGKRVIVRGNNSGVEYGTLKSVEGQIVELADARRIWYWKGAASLSQLAMEGVKNPEKCKFSVYVNTVIIFDMVELIPCTEEAQKSIENVKIWKIF